MEEFVETSKQLGDTKRCMAESLFRVFDENDSGTMDFGEFMMASNCTNVSSINWSGSLELLMRMVEVPLKLMRLLGL
jgi:Ca2+-binding EF-hand superfamily protein